MRCSSIEITGSGISQLEEECVAVTVPKEDIRRVALAYDPIVRHPFLQFHLGFVLVLTGLVLIIASFMVAEGGVYRLHLKSLDFGFGIPLLPLVLWAMIGTGLWLIIKVLFRGNYNVLISTEKGCKKIFFDEEADIREVRSFIERANRELGYDIDLSIMNTMFVRDGVDSPAPPKNP